MSVGEQEGAVGGGPTQAGRAAGGQEIKQIPLIINCSLLRPSFMDYLGSGFKIRVSKQTPRDSVIFPTSGAAALIVPLPPSSSSSSSSKEETLEQLIERVRAFTQGHAGGVVVVVGAVFGQEEIEGPLTTLLFRLLPRPPLLLPAHGEAQAASHIQLLAKILAGGKSGVLWHRLAGVAKTVLSTPVSPHALSGPLSLSPAQVNVLLRLSGSLSGLPRIGLQEATAAGLPPTTINALLSTLVRDTVTL